MSEGLLRGLYHVALPSDHWYGVARDECDKHENAGQYQRRRRRRRGGDIIVVVSRGGRPRRKGVGVETTNMTMAKTAMRTEFMSEEKVVEVGGVGKGLGMTGSD